MDDILLKVEHVSKRFGATQALADVSFAIRKGSIHSLLGRNGAGKSTVVNIIAGLYPQNSGEVTLEGKDISAYSVFERQEMGIKIVPQHAAVVPELTVAENVFLGIWPKTRGGFVDWPKLYADAAVELRKYGLDVDPREKVKRLNGVDQRKVNIVHAMHGGAKLIILDEPTTALSSVERRELFVFVNELKAKGTAFIFISHYLQEVVELSDDVTVIRDGRSFSGSEAGGEFNEERLANLIAGEDVELVEREKLESSDGKEPLIECSLLTGPILDQVSVRLYRGEITGVVGFPGSGAREFCRTLFGMEPLISGTIKKEGRPLSVRRPSDAMRQKIAYVSFDRHKEGIVGLQSIEENVSLPSFYTTLKKRNGFVDRRRSRQVTQHYFDIFHVKANSIDDKMNSLSGGNQQKVLVAKMISIDPELLILDEPTIGIDIKSREEIIENINKVVAEQDMSVLYLTNDFDELLRAVDRILFFSGGRLVTDIRNSGLTHEDVIHIRDTVKQNDRQMA